MLNLLCPRAYLAFFNLPESCLKFQEVNRFSKSDGLFRDVRDFSALLVQYCPTFPETPKKFSQEIL